jgi:hypothetical protein
MKRRVRAALVIAGVLGFVIGIIGGFAIGITRVWIISH